MSFPHGFHTRSNLENFGKFLRDLKSPKFHQGTVEILQDGLPVLLIRNAQRELLWPAVVDEVTASSAAASPRQGYRVPKRNEHSNGYPDSALAEEAGNHMLNSWKNVRQTKKKTQTWGKISGTHIFFWQRR